MFGGSSIFCPGEEALWTLLLQPRKPSELKRMICNRLFSFIELAGASSERQYEFRRACSTVDAIAIVMDFAREAISIGKCCVVVTPEVRNNVYPPQRVPNPARLIEIYLLGRPFWYETNSTLQPSESCPYSESVDLCRGGIRHADHYN